MTSSTTEPLVSNIGDRFSPTDEELVHHYLKQKLLGNDQLVSRIPQLDIYQFDPWDLPRIDSNDREKYFFSPLHVKNPYTNNGKINRSTKTGSWQAKGKDRKITSEQNGEEIGTCKIFVHSCIEDGIKYVMHEYSASSNLPNSRALVLCKVMKKKDKKSKGACKKVKMTEEKAEVLPYNMDISTPASDDGSDVEKWIRDQQAENLTCDGGGTNHVPEFTSLEEIDHEMLPHLISFPGYDQQYYSLGHFTLDKQSLVVTEQLSTNNGPAGTSVSGPEEDLFFGLEPL